MNKLNKILHSATRRMGGETKAKRIAIMSIVAVILVTLVSATFIINTSDDSVAEEDIEVDGCVYTINDVTKTATLKQLKDKTTPVDVAIPGNVQKGGVGELYTVTAIGDSAFYECSGLKSVTIPDSVTTIGEYAFYKCTGGLKSVDLKNVTTIGIGAFYGCSGLTSVTIPKSVTTIGKQAFFGCSSLTSINVVENNPSYLSDGGVLFNKDKTTLIQYPEKKSGNMYEIPNSVTSIDDYAFYDCTGPTSVTIPNSVTSIGRSTFFGCSSLTSVTIPNSVTTIGNYAFSGCSGLTSVTIPNSVTTIGAQAFSGCSGLTSVTIPDSVTTIGNYAFSGCSGLTSVTIPNSVTTIGNNAFLDCSSLVNVIITGTGTAPTSGDVVSKYFKGINWGLPGRTTGIVTLTLEFSSSYAYDLSGITTIATGKIIFGADAKATIGGEFYTADEIPITGASRAGLIFFCTDGKWKEKTLELSFDPNGGTVTPTSKKVTRDSAIGDLPTPTKDGYKFVKWQIDGKDITSETIWTYKGNKTAKAVFEPLPTPDPVDPVNPSPPTPPSTDVSNVLYMGFAVLLTIMLASLVAVLLRSKN